MCPISRSSVNGRGFDFANRSNVAMLLFLLRSASPVSAPPAPTPSAAVRQGSPRRCREPAAPGAAETGIFPPPAYVSTDAPAQGADQSVVTGGLAGTQASPASDAMITYRPPPQHDVPPRPIRSRRLGQSAPSAWNMLHARATS